MAPSEEEKEFTETAEPSSKVKKKAKKKGAKTAEEPAAAIPVITKEYALSSSLLDAVVTGSFIDVAFAVYTRRRAHGVVDKPRLVFANEAVLRSVSDYFSTCASS